MITKLYLDFFYPGWKLQGVRLSGTGNNRAGQGKILDGQAKNSAGQVNFFATFPKERLKYFVISTPAFIQ